MTQDKVEIEVKNIHSRFVNCYKSVEIKLSDSCVGIEPVQNVF